MVQEAGSGARVRGAGVGVGCLLHIEPEERRPVFRSEFIYDDWIRSKH